MLIVCSVVTRESVPQARVLGSMLRDHHPDARLHVFVRSGLGLLRAEEPFEVISAESLRATGGSPEESTPPTPEMVPAQLLRWGLNQGAEVALYLDPCCAVYASLAPVTEAAQAHGIALARRLDRLPDDAKRPHAIDLMGAGRVSSSLVAVSGAEGQRFAAWWADGLRQGGAPGRWLELAGTSFPDIGWVQDPGVAVGFWNLHERTLTREDQVRLVDGSPLRMFDFSGFRPDRPYILSEISERVRILENEALADLCGEYAERLREAGWQSPEPELSGEAHFGNGLPMDPLLRRLWEQAGAEGHAVGDPGSLLAAEAFAEWLRQPAEAGASAGVNRYLHAVYLGRADLQAAFASLDEQGAGLIAWAWEHGRAELGLHPELLPPSPDGTGSSDDAHLTVNVIGYLRDSLGLGEAGRSYVAALEAAGVPIGTTAVLPDAPVTGSAGKAIERTGRRVGEDRPSPYPAAFNLVVMNGDHIAEFARRGGAELLGDALTIGQWAWETDVIPPSWVAGFDHVQEIWAFSNYVSENLARLSPVPVVTVPMGITPPDPRGERSQVIGDERFTYVFMFDFFSTLHRKNPLGLIDAFCRAFAPGEGPRLVLKTINQQFRPEAAEEVRARIGDRPDIEVFDGYLEPAQTAALLARADCYVSLHRSEGFGLTLAESLLLGTPVITTGYSGNMDFTSERNSYLVDWKPAKVGPGSEVYPPEGSWAEPEVDHAAELMRHVWLHPDEAAAKAARGRQDVARQYAPAAAGAVARARLETLLERRTSGPRRGYAGTLGTIERELALDLRRGLPSRRRVGGLVRRLAMRMMLPFTVHERELDRAVLDALHDLRADLERERARSAQARARLRQLEQRLVRVTETGP